MQDITIASSGLDGVVAGATVLSHVDGEAGLLILRGHLLEEVAGRIGFEGIAALLWDDLGEGGGDAESVRRLLGQARVAAFGLVPGLLQVTQGLTPIEALRVGLGMLPDEAALPAHVRACGALQVFLPALLRRGEGKAAVAPDPSLGTAADLLRCLRGQPASPEHVRALDTYLTTIADHGFNASTFAARVVASTQAGMISSLIAGLCALKGPLHGGAPGPVLDMLDEIGSEARIASWVEAAILAGDRLMGFGHRVYKVRDPRADVLKNVVRDLGSHAGRLAFAAEVECQVIAALRRLKPGRRLDTNVEFYTALMLEAVGIPRQAFTPLFAVGRAVGWSAHVMEQGRHGRLVRPLSRYIGPTPKAAA
ncbi:MAG: citrate synthase/methylcitrate synthase [Alphaproteobacteria bacterium]|nr:citrate synthase/methylcitrate synthase [Alphaproteobacteria bacterium]MCW5739923.1 citrate synthase/methylcitrate synthase [Alphaproteobacteria bacterium]